MTMNQQEPPVAGNGRGIGAAELEGIARVFLTTHGDRVQRWTLREGGSGTVRVLRLYSIDPAAGNVAVRVVNEGIVLVESFGDGYLEFDSLDEDVLTTVGLELSANIAGGYVALFSWWGTGVGRRRVGSSPRLLDRLLRRLSSPVPPWPTFGEVSPVEWSMPAPLSLEESAFLEVIEILRSIDPVGIGFDDPDETESWGFPFDEYDQVAQGIVSRAGVPPEELEQWLFVEFSEDWGLAFTRADAAAMREAVEPALERYRSTPDADGTILRGSDDTTDHSREPT